MKKSFGKILIVLLIIALMATCLFACNEESQDELSVSDKQETPSESSTPSDPSEPAQPSDPSEPAQPSDPSEPAQPTVTMTDSYKNGREQFHAITGIWLPELENIELLDSSEFNTTHQTACFDFLGDKDLFNVIFAEVKTIIGRNPLYEGDNGGYWEYTAEANGKNRKYNFDVSYDADNEAGTAIYINGMVRDFYDVTLTASEGGSVVLKMGSHVFADNVATITAGDNLILTATPSIGYEFVGWFVAGESISEITPYTYEAPKANVTIEGRFQEVSDNMDAGYKAARKALYDMSGIVLPELENATTNARQTQIIFDTEDGIGDEFQCEFVFETAEDAAEAYALFKTVIIATEGQPEESMDGMDLWSVLYENVAIPYRDDVMMNIYETSIFLMWREQPIAFYSVETEGNGTAYAVYTGGDYQEHYVERYWEIVDAFHGKVVAIADDGNEFVGWYVNNVQVSTDATYYFNYNQTIDFTEITFVAKFEVLPEPTMTDSYALARTNFQAISGLILPKLASVAGMFEDLGSDMYMVDVNGATQDTLISVIVAFDTQTNSTSTIDNFGKNVWKYTRSDNDAKCELSAFYAEGMVVIMYEEKQMTESYVLAREAFAEATGVTLPTITDLGVDIAFGGTYLMFDIVSGTNLTHDTFEQFLAFFNSLQGWSGQEDEHSSEEYPTYDYSNATSGVSIQVVWNGESESGGIYLNAFNTLSIFDKYSVAKECVEQRFDIILPEMENVTVEFSCAEDATWMTFDLTKGSDFTEAEYNQFVSALAAELGNGTDASDEYQKKTTWTVGEAMWDVTWDLGTSLAVNFG